MATEYILAATMLFGSYANPIEVPINGVFSDPVRCMSHWQAASRRSGMTFLNIEGTVCVESRGVARTVPAAAPAKVKLSPEERAARLKQYEGEIRASQWLLKNAKTEQDRLDAEALIRKYESRIAALQ